MRTKLCLLATMLVCLLLQCSLLPALAVASVTPNLMVVFTATFGLMRGKREGMALGFVCGLLTDLMLPGLFIGLRAFVYMYIGYFCGYCYHIFYDDDVKMPVLLTAAGDLAYGLMFYITQFLLRGRIDFPYYLRRLILPEMIYTILLAFLCYRPFLKINRQLEKLDKRSVGSFV